MIKKGEIARPYYLKNIVELRHQGVNAEWASPTLILQHQRMPSEFPRFLGPTDTPSGTWNALVILIKFSDKPQQVSAESFDELIFGESGGSMKDYFRKVSYSTLDIVTVDLPSSLGWITAPETYSYYVNGQNGFGEYPQNAQKLVEDVVRVADDAVDFSQYDNDSDGYVDALFIVHAGSGGEYTGSNDDIWSHAWVTNSPQSVDGVAVWRYSIEPEFLSSPGDITIGVYAHELGHALFGLPDLYDRDDDPGETSRGLGRWSLMAGGSWNGILGDSPAFPDAWSHIQMGYVAPTVVVENAVGQSIQNVESSPEIFRLWTNGTAASEYFLLENRQQVGYDTYLPGSGILVYHMDESVTNQNDDEWYPGHTSYGHYLVALEQADGLYDLEKDVNSGDSGDPFPGSTGNTTFDGLSSPGSRDYSGYSTEVAVTNISGSSSTMTADLSVYSEEDDQEELIAPTSLTAMAWDSTVYLSWSAPSRGTANLHTQSPVGTSKKEAILSSKLGAISKKLLAFSYNRVTISPDETVLSNHQSPAYFWHLPNDYGDLAFGEHFTPTDAGSLKTAYIGLYGYNPDYTTGDLVVGVWSSDVAGIPDHFIGSVTVPNKNLDFSDTDQDFISWQTVEISSLDYGFSSGHKFAISFGVSNGSLALLSDSSQTNTMLNQESDGVWMDMSAWGITPAAIIEAGVEYTGGPVLQGYNVYVSGIKINEDIIANTNVTLTGLTNLTEYCFTLTAVYDLGESRHSNAACVTPGSGTSLAPAILSISDVANDEGGQVRIEFTRSQLDDENVGNPIVDYTIWRWALRGLWENVGNLSASGEASYQYVAPTECDSTTTTVCWTIFKISAQIDNPETYYFSDPDSGYSIDNSGANSSHILATNYDSHLPSKYSLHRNYPNPFNPITNIRYDLPNDSRVTLIIYDILGRQVRTLVNDRKVAGYHSALWDGKDIGGSPVATGVYIYRLEARGINGAYSKVRKMLFLK